MEPPISGSNFRSTVFESIEDPVSSEIMTKAVSLIPCGHTLNEDTATKIIASSNLCPLDRCPIQGYTPNYVVRDIAKKATLHPSKEGPSREAQELFLKGKKLTNQKKYEEAVAIFLDALYLSPSYERAHVYLNFCLKQTSSKLPPPSTSSDVSEREKFTKFFSEFLNNPLIKNNKVLYSIFATQLDALINQETPELTQQHEILYEWAQRLLTQNKVHQHVVKKNQEICRGSQKQPSVIPSLISSTPSITLHQAVKQGDLDAIKLLIDKGARVNARNKDDLTPLHFAARYGHVDAIKLLIDKGARVNARNKDDLIPLHFAARYGHVDAIKLLIDNGANVDFRTGFEGKWLNWPPLNFAARYGHIGAMRLLIYKGAEVDANTLGGRPLVLAAKNGYIGAMKLLIDNGANVNDKYRIDLTPLHYVAKNGYIDAIKLLIDNGANVNAKARNGCLTPLHLAASNGHVDAMKLLIDNRAEVDATNKADSTPLHFAASNGCVDAIELLIDNGVQVTATNKADSTPLHFAASNGHVDAIKLLVDKGAQVDVKDKDDLTPLHLAASNGCADAIELLIDNGAEVDAKDKDDLTPLHFAASNGCVDAIELLIDNGANVDARENDAWVWGGLSPLHRAAQNGHIDAIKLLIKNGAKVDNRSLREAEQNNQREAVEVLRQYQSKWECKVS